MTGMSIMILACMGSPMGGDMRCCRNMVAPMTRGDIVGILGREVGQPDQVREGQLGDERGVPQLDGPQQGLIQGEKHGDLQQHGHAPAGWVDLVGLVQLHDFRIHLLTVVGVLLADLGHHGLELLHLLHGFVALVRKGPEQSLDDDRQDDDGHAVVAHVPVQEMQELVQGLAMMSKP